MSENFYEQAVHDVIKMQTELKLRLEQVSKLRIDCAKMQLELLKLYKPQCLEILEMLRDVSATPEESCDNNDDNDVTSRNKGSEVLRANEDVSRKSTT